MIESVLRAALTGRKGVVYRGYQIVRTLAAAVRAVGDQSDKDITGLMAT